MGEPSEKWSNGTCIKSYGQRLGELSRRDTAVVIRL